MSVTLPAPAKHPKRSSRYYRKQTEHKEGGNMAYMIGTRFLIQQYELIDSGTVNLFSDEFEIEVSNMRVLFKFMKDKKMPEASFESADREDNNLSLTLYNFTNPLPQGYFSPVKIGSLHDGISLYMSFVVQTTHERLKARIFTFNLYMDRKTDGR
jgi:hypothetical protein